MPADRRYDLVVVGVGTGGIPCAVEAAARGARVLPVEKDFRIGGTLHITGGHMNELPVVQWPPPVAADDRARRYLDMIRHIFPASSARGTGLRSDG
ncbi:FAD-binding protein [Actinomadura sp. NTSP31]|uniref:FAD-binding protein n=1 Tax=Actinomadura sp. NTSP31 TaxID=1735447 RepID=UPI0035C043A1